MPQDTVSQIERYHRVMSAKDMDGLLDYMFKDKTAEIFESNLSFEEQEQAVRDLVTDVRSGLERGIEANTFTVDEMAKEWKLHPSIENRGQFQDVLKAFTVTALATERPVPAIMALAKVAELDRKQPTEVIGPYLEVFTSVFHRVSNGIQSLFAEKIGKYGIGMEGWQDTRRFVPLKPVGQPA